MAGIERRVRVQVLDIVVIGIIVITADDDMVVIETTKKRRRTIIIEMMVALEMVVIWSERGCWMIGTTTEHETTDIGMTMMV